MKIRSREMNIFSMSALDLFASALGAFIILAVVALPFFPNTSLYSDAELQARLDTAEAAIAELESSLSEAESQRDQAREQSAELEQQSKDLQAELSEIRVEDMDLVIVMDVTSSMGDAVEGLKSEVRDLIKVLDRITPSLGVGIIAYGDRQFERPVTLQDILDTSNAAELDRLNRFVDGMTLGMGQGNGGNSEFPEALHLALARLSTMGWRSDAPERHVVVFTDAPTYPEEVNNAIETARVFATGGQYQVSTVQVGNNSTTADVLQAIAAAGNGRYVNQDSGESFMTALLLAVLR
ncbi:MAG: hypothetical protein CVV16_03330 [Gammaproteobacteria bacterium HGW-Gammaproteobacteria-6]|nr:MAG: hypothetical protein CVV16_03330 [Gammaproteobacteria bacterium HGW-Gammaproteobacteria-6]